MSESADRLSDETVNKIVNRVAAGARLNLPHREMCRAVWDILREGALSSGSSSWASPSKTKEHETKKI